MRTPILLTTAVAWALVVAPVGHAVDLQPTDDLDLDPDLDVDLPDLPLADASGPDPSNTEEHMPIRIHGDKEFDLPTSGVVEGNGTADDPYVIRGWEITPTVWRSPTVDGDPVNCDSAPAIDLHASAGDREFGVSIARHAIELVDTTAHVVIEANYLHALPEDENPNSQHTAAIFLQNADHVTIRHNRIGNTSEDALQRGVCAKDASDLAVEGTTVRNAKYPVEVEDTAGFRFDGNTLDAPAGTGAIGLDLAGVDDAWITFNRISNQIGMGITAVSVPDIVVANNTLAKNGADGISLSGADGARVRYNEVTQNGVGSATDGIAIDTSQNVHVHHNNLEDNGDDGLDNGRQETNATKNWWGCPGGPDDADCDNVEGNGRVRSVAVEPGRGRGSVLDGG